MANVQNVTVQATQAALSALAVPSATFPSNATMGIVSANGEKYYLVANTGNPSNGTTILDASDGRQWVRV